MMKTCVFDAVGNLINIGEWDYREEQVVSKSAIIDEETQEVVEPAEYETILRNPLPDGAYSEEKEVYQDDDGAWRIVGTAAPKTPEQEIEELRQQNALMQAALDDLILSGGGF